ncbi:MAG TPA: Dyp-type peroxidase [Acidimicrobiales bacterium]|nr:Dyp-type peroxidase [Acidimicrobiales bacterium]
MQPQPGIFSLGTPEHCYLEFDLKTGTGAAQLISVLAGLIGPETTVRGLSLVVGFRPELWGNAAPEAARSHVRSFEAIAGAGIDFPATQHDAWLWIAGGRRDVVFDSALRVMAAAAPLATVAGEITGWLYQHDRDLTGFIDGTENPPLLDAQDVAVLPQDGSSVLLFQKWVHHPDWRHLSDSEQERVIGRTKPDSVQLDDDVMPDDSHVSRTVVEENGEELHIFRRNVGYGGPTDHGTVFVGFCATQYPLDLMLRRMAGADGGIRDALTRYTAPVSGSYYVIPSVDALARFVAA